MVNHLISQLEKIYLFEKTHNALLAKIECLIGILGGVFLGAYFINESLLFLFISVVFIAVFLYLFYRRYILYQHFNMPVVGELKATLSLQNIKAEQTRKQFVTGSITQSLTALNNQTCYFNAPNKQNLFCEKGIESGLLQVFKSYVHDTSAMLGAANSTYTIGMYINGFFQFPNDYGKVKSYPYAGSDMFVLKDDLGLSSFMVKDILKNEDLFELSFFFQTQFLDSFKHGKFVKKDFLWKEKDYTIITAPVPTTNNEGAIGIFFIISPQLSVIPEDIPSEISIFNQIFSNWLAKYNECVFDCCESMSQLLDTIHSEEDFEQTATIQQRVDEVINGSIPTSMNYVEEKQPIKRDKVITNIFFKKELYQGSLNL